MRSTRLGAALFAVATSLVAASCASDDAQTRTGSTSAGSTTTTVREVTCVDPPAAELARVSQLPLVAESIPVTAGAELYLSIDAPVGARDVVGGAAAEWQCWDGSAWVATHQLVRDWGERDPQTLEAFPGATTTIPAIGLPVPNRHRVIVPDVPPGTYRIADSVFIAGGNELDGFTIVDVVER